MTTPKSERLHIGIFGRTNVGKSSVMNLIAGQDVALISDIAGTTTDVVEKSIELLPIGPVVVLDSAGVDDSSELGSARKNRTNKVFQRCDFALLIIEPNVWTDFENDILRQFQKYNLPFLVVVNKIDISNLAQQIRGKIAKFNAEYLEISAVNFDERNNFLNKIKTAVSKNISIFDTPKLFDNILHAGDICIMITPIDSGAPKGRIIAPQAQTLREALDLHAVTIVIQPEEYVKLLKKIHKTPRIVICDSQVVKFMVENTPANIDCTTFSILFARLKGDLAEDVKGAKTIDTITVNEKILIAEACSHHAQKDDIGTKKIPDLLTKYLGFTPKIEYSHGRDYPANLNEYSLIIHCGACMLTRNEKLNRIKEAQKAGVSITNYGIAISFMNGYLDRVTKIFDIKI